MAECRRPWVALALAVALVLGLSACVPSVENGTAVVDSKHHRTGSTTMVKSGKVYIPRYTPPAWYLGLSQGEGEGQHTSRIQVTQDIWNQVAEGDTICVRNGALDHIGDC